MRRNPVNPAHWQPGTFLRFVRSLGTSTRAAEIVTDAGNAYIKALGNPEGPHALACEWVGTQLAALFGLRTFQIALLNIDSTTDEIPFRKGGNARSGTAFCARAEKGHGWGGAPEELDALENPEDITRLVIFDTWIRNRDRHHPDYSVRRPNRDNVFLSAEGTVPGQWLLIAMDHTHCFATSLNSRIARIDNVRDNLIYGLFPEFQSRLRRDVLDACLRDLQNLRAERIRPLIESIPTDWEVNRDTRDALQEFILHRAQHLSATFESLLSQNHIVVLQ